MKPGDFVHCLGEGDDIFQIREIFADTAWLQSHLGSIGWENLDKLNIVNPSEIKARVNKLIHELSFLACS